MKSKKAKIEKKAAKKSEKRVVMKELQTSITDKFLDVIRSFGHEAGNLTKDVKRLSKSLAKNLADKVSSINSSEKPEKSGKSQAIAAKPGIKRAVKAPKKTLTKAEKVVARAVTASGARKRTAPAAKVSSPAKVSATKTAAAGTATTGTAKNSRVTASKTPKTASRKQVSAVKSVSGSKSGTATAPAIRKPRVKRVSPEKLPPVNDASQPVITGSDLDRTNNSDTM